jgi:cyclophilin family peptidyl-prolyl cis-trans isomerase/HEAT repeat protein
MRITLHTENFSGAPAHPAFRARFLASLFCAAVLLLAPESFGQNTRLTTPRRATKSSSRQVLSSSISLPAMMRIVRAEDERRWDADLLALLTDKSALVRRRAALAAGRIGDERAVASLSSLLRGDADANVKAMAAFALGETESAAGADALIESLRASTSSTTSEVRARAIEALGKIAAALPKTEEARSRILGNEILEALANESSRAAQPDRAVLLAGLTAVLRARPANAGSRIAAFLSSTDARVRADAANTLARLRAKDATDQLRKLLQQDGDAVVRANAARALGAAEDQAAFDALANKSVNDADERVRVSAIRALGSLKDARAATVLVPRADSLLALYRTARAGGDSHPQQANELLEIATTLGRVLDKTNDARALAFLRGMREAENFRAPEIEIAFAHIAPTAYIRERPFTELADEQLRFKILKDWRAVSGLSQGLAELAKLTNADSGNSAVGLQVEAQTILRSWLDDADTSAVAVPDVLRALATFKPNDLTEELRRHLNDKDVMVRAAAAELLGDAATTTTTTASATAATAATAAASNETNARSLAASLPIAMRDEMNDAALAILDALAKQKTNFANDAIKIALASPDHLLRRRAVALLKANNAGDYSARIGTVATGNTIADYTRALARSSKIARAFVTTDKGSFTLDLLPNDAPLTVDSFVQLARRGFFDNTDFHRVVPNFVIQGGDRTRGDGNGGPGYQIRCEINEAAYDRGAVGMALSGKDTGGSQWFVTHSPQPHLDGGYTVFGRVIQGMDVVDRIARGDRIRRITITEGNEARSAFSNAKTAPVVKSTATRRKRTAP